MMIDENGRLEHRWETRTSGPGHRASLPRIRSRAGLEHQAKRQAAQHHRNMEKILSGVRVRPILVSPPIGELGYPTAPREALAALSLDSPGAPRHSINIVRDDSLPPALAFMPLAVESRRAVLMCRLERLASACEPAMRRLPDEIWQRVFALASVAVEVPNVVEMAPGQPNEVVARPARRHTCDHVFGPDTSCTGQRLVYEASVAPLVESALDGFSTAFITYGPRGSGKSYTLEGSEGMMRQAIQQLFLAMRRRHGDVWGPTDDFVRFSSYAVHRRIVYDLVAPEAPVHTVNSNPRAPTYAHALALAFAGSARLTHRDAPHSLLQVQRKLGRTNATGQRVNAFIEVSRGDLRRTQPCIASHIISPFGYAPQDHLSATTSTLCIWQPLDPAVLPPLTTVDRLLPRFAPLCFSALRASTPPT